MQYMKTSVAIRIDSDLLDQAKTAAKAEGSSFTAYVVGALQARLNPVSIEPKPVPKYDASNPPLPPGVNRGMPLERPEVEPRFKS